MKKTLALLICAATLAFSMTAPAEAGRRNIVQLHAHYYFPLFLGVGY